MFMLLVKKNLLLHTNTVLTLDTRDFPCQYPDKENYAGWAMRTFVLNYSISFFTLFEHISTKRLQHKDSSITFDVVLLTVQLQT